MDDMTQTTGPTTGPTHTNGLDRFFDWFRSIDLRREGDDRWLAGVCSGIATRLGVDAIVIRAAVVLLVVLGGIGVLVYLIAWAFLPNDKEEILAERGIRDGDWRGILLLVVIALSLVGGPGFADNSPGLGWIWWFVLPIGLVVWLVKRGRRPATVGPAPAYGAPTYGAPTYGAPSAPGAAPYGGGVPQAGPAPAAGPGMYASAPATDAPPTTTWAPQPASWGPQGVGAYPPGSTPPAPPSPRTPRPPRAPRAPRRRGGGFGATLLIGGLALAAYGLTSWLHQANDWAGSDQTVGLAAALAVMGLGVLVLAVSGRRAGFTGFLAIVLAIVTWSASVVPDVSLGGGIGERVWRPSTSDTTSAYRLGIGSARLDLADAQDNPATPREIDARVGIGELLIFVPEGLTVEVRSSVAAGDITSVSDPFSTSSDGPGTNGSISTVHTVGTGTPDVVVTAHVGLGEIQIGKE